MKLGMALMLFAIFFRIQDTIPITQTLDYIIFIVGVSIYGISDR